MNCEFVADKPYQKWVTDVTEFKCGRNKKSYLSSVLDLYDKSFVASGISRQSDNQLVFTTMWNALDQATWDYTFNSQ